MAPKTGVPHRPLATRARVPHRLWLLGRSCTNTSGFQILPESLHFVDFETWVAFESIQRTTFDSGLMHPNNQKILSESIKLQPEILNPHRPVAPKTGVPHRPLATRARVPHRLWLLGRSCTSTNGFQLLPESLNFVEFETWVAVESIQLTTFGSGLMHPNNQKILSEWIKLQADILDPPRHVAPKTGVPHRSVATRARVPHRL